LRNRIDHSARARALPQLAILPQLERNIAHIHIGINEWPNRRVRIKRFATAKLLFLFLQIAVGNIEADCVTEHMIERLVYTDVFRWSADHDREFYFEIRSIFGKRNFDRALMRQKRARRLKPD